VREELAYVEIRVAAAWVERECWVVRRGDSGSGATEGRR